MKTSGLLSSLCVGVMIAGCGSIANYNDYQYLFSTGDNFSNQEFVYSRPQIPYFENDFLTQNEEHINHAHKEIDISTSSHFDIKEGGTYVLKGLSTNCSIDINTTGVVNLIFDGINLTSIGATPIQVENAKMLNVHIKEKTKNYICDSQTNDDNSAIYANCPVNISGKGFLYLNSYGKTRKPSLDRGRCIYSTKDLTVEDARIIVKLSTGTTFESEGDIYLNNTKIDIKFSCGGGIKAKGNVYARNTTFIYTGSMDAISATDNNLINSNFYIFTVGNYKKIDHSVQSLDPTGVYYIKKDSDFVRVNPEKYDKVRTLYQLTESTRGIISRGKSNFVNSNFYLDTDDDSIASSGDLLSDKSKYYIKTSNQGIVSAGALNFVDDKKAEDEFPVKIFESYSAIKGDEIVFDGASTYVDASQSGIETSGENSDITFKNASKLIVDTDVFALLSHGNINVDNSFIGVFGGTDTRNNLLENAKQVNINKSTMVVAQNKKTSYRPKRTKQNTLSISLGQRVPENGVVHVKSKKRNFISSIIVPKAYEDLMVTISSDLLAKDDYVVSKAGVLDYKFIRGISINKGYPYEDENILDMAITDDNSFVYSEVR